jgi:hypothetical protein
MPLGVEPYDEKVTLERIIAVGDVYYLYQHEKIGVFRVVQKLGNVPRRCGAPVRRPGLFAGEPPDARDHTPDVACPETAAQVGMAEDGKGVFEH